MTPEAVSVGAGLLELLKAILPGVMAGIGSAWIIAARLRFQIEQLWATVPADLVKIRAEIGAHAEHLAAIDERCKERGGKE